MDALLLIARLVLAGVFATAGIAKLLDLKGSQRAVREFGVPDRYAAIVGLGLPVLELIVAFFLLPVATARYAALMALLLLLAFIGGIVWNLRQGRTPDCHCFGQLHSEPAGPRTLIRNAALAALALFIVVAGWNDPGYALLGWADDLSGFEWAMLVFSLIMLAALAGLAWVVLHLIGQNGRQLLRVDELERQLTAISAGESVQAAKLPSSSEAPKAPLPGLPVGTTAPGFSLKGIYGEVMTLDAIRAANKPVLLIFSDPNCGPCTKLMPEIADWQRDHGSTFSTVMVSRGKPEDNLEKARANSLGMVLLQENREVFESYKSPGTPSAVVIGADGNIATPIATGPDRIRELVRELIDGPPESGRPVSGNRSGRTERSSTPPRPSPSPAVGTVAPSVLLKDLDGEDVELESLFNEDAVLIFWSPTCGFCRRMADDIIAWERETSEDAPRAIIITSGDVEKNREFGFASIVLDDPSTQAMKLYGTTGTPSAIKIAKDGTVASELRIGQPGVMSLLRNEPAPSAPEGRKSLELGASAPDVKLPDLDGASFDLATLKGRETAVIFWNPGCGYCNRMLDDLKSWESEKPDDAPELLLVSTGTIEANEAQGLSSRIVIDQGFKVGRTFGASGTPSAILVDKDGKIASTLAVGATNVLTLARGSNGTGG